MNFCIDNTAIIFFVPGLVQLFRGLLDSAAEDADKTTIVSLSKEYSIDII